MIKKKFFSNKFILKYLDSISFNNYHKYIVYNPTNELAYIINYEKNLKKYYAEFLKQRKINKGKILLSNDDGFDDHNFFKDQDILWEQMNHNNFNSIDINNSPNKLLITEDNNISINLWPTDGSKFNYIAIITPILNDYERIPIIFGEEFIDLSNLNSIVDPVKIQSSLNLFKTLPHQSLICGKYTNKQNYIDSLNFTLKLFESDQKISNYIKLKLKEIQSTDINTPNLISTLGDELLINPYLNIPSYIPSPKVENLKKIQQEYFKNN